MRAIPPLLQAPSPLPPEWDELCPEAGVWTGCHPKHRVLQGTAPLCRRGKPRIPLPRGQTLSCGVPPAAPVASLGPLAFSEHSMPLLSALAGPDLPLECQESNLLDPGIEPTSHVSCIGRFFTTCATREAQIGVVYSSKTCLVVLLTRKITLDQSFFLYKAIYSNCMI